MRLDWELILNFRVGSRGVFMLSMLERRGRPRMVVRFGNVPNMVPQFDRLVLLCTRNNSSFGFERVLFISSWLDDGRLL